MAKQANITNNVPEAPIRIAWVNFTNSVKLLLVPRKNNRPLDQYLELRDKVFVLVQGEQFLEDLEKAFMGMDSPQVQEPLLLELQAFPRALEVAQTTSKPEKKKRWLERWGNFLLGQASTVTGSVKDIVANLPPMAKNGLTLFKEVIDLFKGKD